VRGRRNVCVPKNRRVKHPPLGTPDKVYLTASIDDGYRKSLSPEKLRIGFRDVRLPAT
jgi:hypothetical protein